MCIVGLGGSQRLGRRPADWKSETASVAGNDSELGTIRKCLGTKQGTLFVYEGGAPVLYHRKRGPQEVVDQQSRRLNRGKKVVRIETVDFTATSRNCARGGTASSSPALFQGIGRMTL